LPFGCGWPWINRLTLLRGLRHQDAVIVLSVLKVVFRRDAVTSGTGIARELQVFLIDMSRRAADLDVRSRRIESPVVTLLRPPAASP